MLSGLLLAGVAWGNPTLFVPLPMARPPSGWPQAYGPAVPHSGVRVDLPAFDRLAPQTRLAAESGFTLVMDEDELLPVPTFLRRVGDRASTAAATGSEAALRASVSEMGQALKATGAEMELLASKAGDTAISRAKSEVDQRLKDFERDTVAKVDALNVEASRLRENLAGYQAETKALERELAFWKWLTGGVATLLFLNLFKDLWRRTLERHGWLTPAASAPPPPTTLSGGVPPPSKSPWTV